MRINKRFAEYLLRYFFMIVLASCILQGCKDDTVTETETNNNNNQEPNAPQLSSPANNSTITAISPNLSWASFNGATSYRIQVSMDANFISTLIEDSVVSGTGFNVAQGLLTTNVYYYWRVYANLQSGTSNFSAVWRFRIVQAPPPAPILVTPPNNSTGESFTPLFDWNDAPTAQMYRIQVSSNPNFTNIAFDSAGVIPSTLQCPPFFLITGTQYFWRVNASNSNGASTSSWSATFNFTTISGPLPNSIGGTVTFADTLFLNSQNGYIVGAYVNNNWPPNNFTPVSFDTLEIQHIGNTYQANYLLRNL